MLSTGVGVNDRLSRLDPSHDTSTLISHAETPDDYKIDPKTVVHEMASRVVWSHSSVFSHTTGFVGEC